MTTTVKETVSVNYIAKIANQIDKSDTPFYDLKKASDCVCYLQSERYVMPVLEKIHAKLEVDKYNKNKPFQFYDDNLIWTESPKDQEIKVLICQTQDCNFLFSFSSNFLHIRKFWNKYEGPKDKFDIENENRFKTNFEKDGIAYLLKDGDDYRKFSDNVLNKKYLRKPDLDYFRNLDYLPKYGDCRDIGYILSCNFYLKYADTILATIPEIDDIFNNILVSAAGSLLGCEFVDQIKDLKI